MLEPCEGKLSRTVLRGERDSNIPDLLDRPSDLEQRSGRIIRQGNMNDEVDIYRYVTQETFDAYLYQLVENKQKFISQIMTSRSPVRSAEDIDETALSYAEIKMLATGNPHIKEKMDLDIQVAKLTMLKQNFLSQKYSLEDKIIGFYPKEIERFEEQLKGFRSDHDHVKALDPNRAFEMQVGETSYTEKREAGDAILKFCRDMKSPDKVPLGSYNGFDMCVYYDSFSREFEIEAKREMRYYIPLGEDPIGNITRIGNAISGIDKKIENVDNQLENVTNQFENAKNESAKEFPQESELKEKMSRLNELNALLNMDERDPEIIEEGDERTDEDDRTHESCMER